MAGKVQRGRKKARQTPNRVATQQPRARRAETDSAGGEIAEDGDAPRLSKTGAVLKMATPPLTLSVQDAKPRRGRGRGHSRSQQRAAASGIARIEDYKHDATRKNNPPAGLAELDRPPPIPRRTYSYDPHLDPKLTWAGKAERTSFEVETVSLHIHERVSTEAILHAVKREEAQRELFEQTQLPPSKQIEFYQHEVGWMNRLILGDSLVVMNSLLEREHMAGKVQCIYIDPPYGVKFNSNFQPTVAKRDVTHGDDASLTREPEQIQAYRDTWALGIHSYLAYLRDRLLLSRELLTETGSLFVQISDENLHHVRELLDEVFGSMSFVSQISFAKTTGATTRGLPGTLDYILWYAKDPSQTKFRPLFKEKRVGEEGADKYDQVLLASGEVRTLSAEERLGRPLPPGARVFTLDNLTSQSIGREKGEGAASWFPVEIDGREFRPNSQSRWKTNEAGMARLVASQRVRVQGNNLRYVRFLDDFPAFPLNNLWADVGGVQSRSDPKIYVVQTSTTAIARCVQMTTDPGDLVLDPTCGAGTTAVVAEQWGRRWITCDTSRVALALARQRILTARYPYYRLRTGTVRDGFVYRTVPHITLKSIAQNPRLDECTTPQERDRVTRETAEQEILYDDPEVAGDRVRIAGPFTVEAIPVAALAVADGEDGSPEASLGGLPALADAEFIQWLIDKLRVTGIVFPDGKDMKLPSLRPVRGPWEWLHAEAEMGQNGGTKRVAVSFGPRHAPVTPHQVFRTIDETRGYDIVLFIGFSCDPEAGRVIAQGIHGRQLFYANAAPDILVGDLLKTKKTTRLFSVFGQPDVQVHPEDDGHVSVELAGVDLYDPTTGDTSHEPGEHVAAWFVDHDYDGRTFCICQALFPGKSTKNPWEKLQRALRGTIDEDKFEQLRTARSLPFKPGKKVAVKVIDQRGNEVIRIVPIDAKAAKGKGRRST